MDELIVGKNDLNKLSSALKSDTLKYREIEHAANKEIEVLMDEIMRLQDAVSDLEDKISTFSKNEMFMLRYEKVGKEHNLQLTQCN